MKVSEFKKVIKPLIRMYQEVILKKAFSQMSFQKWPKDSKEIWLRRISITGTRLTRREKGIATQKRSYGTRRQERIKRLNESASVGCKCL